MSQPFVTKADTLSSELGFGEEIDAANTTPPIQILAPSPGKRLSLRGVYITTNSNGGEIWVYFRDSGQIVTKIYCVRQAEAIIPGVNFIGNVDEPLMLNWDGLSSGAKIYVAIRYKEV